MNQTELVKGGYWEEFVENHLKIKNQLLNMDTKFLL